MFFDAGHRLYLVGGVVRDAVAGRFMPEADMDCATDARPESIRRIVSEAASSVWEQGARFGTVGCILDGRTFEITTYRADTYDSDSRKPRVVFGDNIEDDLLRRDFTVNAMAVDLQDGSLLDPHGGRRDLANRMLRTPRDPAISFTDDPLRMLRAARFIATHGLRPSADITAAVAAMRDRLQIVAAERIRVEIERLLLVADPIAGLDFLWASGLVREVLPHCVHRSSAQAATAVAAVDAVPAARWAALFVSAPADAVPSLKTLRSPNAHIAAVTGLLDARSVLMAAAPDPVSVRRVVAACRVDIDLAAGFAAAIAPVLGEPTAKLDAFVESLAELRSQEDVADVKPALDGTEVMAVLGIEPGEAVGRALGFLRDLAFEQGPVGKDEASEALRRWQASQLS